MTARCETKVRSSVSGTDKRPERGTVKDDWAPVSSRELASVLRSSPESYRRSRWSRYIAGTSVAIPAQLPKC
jgi:hypothetical protein